MTNGKAGNLAILSKIEGIRVPEFIVLEPNMPLAERKEVVEAFLAARSCSAVAVRSSAANEDSAEASFAGMYATKLNVPADLESILSVVDEISAQSASKPEVLSHYIAQRNMPASLGEMAVIVQEMIASDTAGVIFSHDPSTRDGYYVVSISEGLGEHIVSGSVNGKLIRVARATDAKTIKTRWLAKTIEAMRAIERHYVHTSLDVEFAFKDETLYILQCRPLTAVQNTVVSDSQEEELACQIRRLREHVRDTYDGDLLGDMIDINPAELLGSSPSPLDVSLFDYLFADRVVEQVRKTMGYDPLHGGLLRTIAGKPYVSLRSSAFSFRPKGIPTSVYENLYLTYRESVVKNRGLQSRVEFDVYAMSSGPRLEKIIRDAGLSKEDAEVVREAFVRLDTVFVSISDEESVVFETYAKAYENWIGSLANYPLEHILALVAEGTERFVRVARLAFYWKNKFEELHPHEELNELVVGYLHSVSGQLQHDLASCLKGTLTKEALVARYGHLRPGQFSVFGESYADDPEHYLFAQIAQSHTPAPTKRAHAFEATAEFKNVIMFMQARETMKFLFAKAFSVFIDRLKIELTERHIPYADAAAMTWNGIAAYLRGETAQPPKPEPHIPMLLPDVLVPETVDLEVITSGEAMPSYITKSVVKARVCVLESPSAGVDVAGAIVLLPNADPGYDFLFHSNAAGIITKVGGPASHMCMRASELQMPACIGCGEHVYTTLLAAQTVVLDCEKKQIIVL